MTGGKPDHKYKGKGPLDTESLNLIKHLTKVQTTKRRAITETFDSIGENELPISFLDENRLLNL